MMNVWVSNHAGEERLALTTEQRLELVRRDLEELERRIAFIEATISAIRENGEGAAE